VDCSSLENPIVESRSVDSSKIEHQNANASSHPRTASLVLKKETVCMKRKEKDSHAFVCFFFFTCAPLFLIERWRVHVCMSACCNSSACPQYTYAHCSNAHQLKRSKKKTKRPPFCSPLISNWRRHTPTSRLANAPTLSSGPLTTRDGQQ
jgi:hypothetical protein